MQINNILPVILNLFTSVGKGQESSKQKNLIQLQNKLHASQAKDTLPRAVYPAKNTQQTGGAERVFEGQTSSGRSIINKDSGGPQNEFIFLPIPLNSDIFPNAKFYKQILNGENGKQKENKEHNRLVFGLNTPSLGEIYFMVVQRDANLSIKCAASKAQTVKAIREELNKLKDKLNQMEWEKIHCSCIHVEKPGELPGMPPSGFINLRI